MKLAPGQFFGQTLGQCRNAGLTLTVSRYLPAQEQPLHVHTHPTLFIPIMGEHRDQTRTGACAQQELSPVFHPTFEPHASVVGHRGMVGLNLEFEPAWLEDHELTERSLGGYRLPEATVWSRLAAVRLVCRALRPAAGAWWEIHTLALELLEPLVQRAVPPAEAGCPGWLRQAEEFLHARFGTSISLRAVAREAGVHPVYCARVFRRRHGCPVSAYLRALRLAEAGWLVLRQGRSLADAALAAGFADQPHLSRCFNRQFGFGPRALRAARDFFSASM